MQTKQIASDPKRLAQIRADTIRWCAIRPEAKNWNDAYLLSIIDQKGLGIMNMRTRVVYILLGFALGLFVTVITGCTFKDFYDIKKEEKQHPMIVAIRQ